MDRGGSAWVINYLPNGIDSDTHWFRGAEATGGEWLEQTNWSFGNGSTYTYYDPIAGASKVAAHWTGQNATGVLSDFTINYGAGGSFREFLNPSAYVANYKEYWTGADQTGSEMRVTNLTSAGSNSQLAHPGSDVEFFNLGYLSNWGGNVSQLAHHYSGSDGTGTLLYTTVEFASPGPYGAMSAIAYLNTYQVSFWDDPTIVNGQRNQVDYRAGPNTSGNLLHTDKGPNLNSSPVGQGIDVKSLQVYSTATGINPNISQFIPNFL